MNIPAVVSVLNGAFATDGGSISLLLSDAEGLRYNLLLTQHLLPPDKSPGARRTGRLYFNGTIVEVRSEDELAIIGSLKGAEIKAPDRENNPQNTSADEQPGMTVGDDIADYLTKIAEGPEAALLHLVRELIRYVESEEYVRYAARHSESQDRSTMKAIVMYAYGGPEVLELKEVDRPEISENDVLVRVHAAGLNAGDCFSMRGSPWLIRFSVGFPKPKGHIPGWELSGHVEEVGSNVKRFQPGDRVFGCCDYTLAEFVCANEGKFAAAPANISLEEAATIPVAASTALHALRDKAKVKPGQKVLINGSSGGVGTFSVQIAKALGAEVTGVCSTRNVDMVRSLGADHVIDYTREDFTVGGPRFDLVLDNIGSRSFSDCRRVLLPGGIHLPNTGHAGMSYVFKAYILSMLMRKHMSPFYSIPSADDLIFLRDLIEAGKLKPVIDTTYTLSETAQAFRYIEEDHARGKVVVLVPNTQL